MDVSCIVYSIFAIALTIEWIVILFYCKLKFKFRYLLASCLASVSVLVILHLTINCSNQLFPKGTAVRKLQHNDGLLRSVRNVKPEVRELLNNNELLTHHTIHIKDNYDENRVKRKYTDNNASRLNSTKIDKRTTLGDEGKTHLLFQQRFRCQLHLD